MNLAEKIKHLRDVEGELRDLGRPMTQIEVVKAMQEELNEHISQAYLSQLESGKRLHLTASSRDLLARFFKVHPGYLVSDPPDYSIELLTDIQHGDTHQPDIGDWLAESAAEWHAEPELRALLQALVNSRQPGRAITLLRQLMDLPLEELEAIVEAVTSVTDHRDNQDTEMHVEYPSL